MAFFWNFFCNNAHNYPLIAIIIPILTFHCNTYCLQLVPTTKPLLHVTGPSHGPCVHIPHSASIPTPLRTVPVSAWTRLSPQVLRNSSCISNRHYWQLAKDVFDWEYIKDRVFRIQLIYDSRAYWFQPFYRENNIQFMGSCNTCNNIKTYHAQGWHIPRE